jgi:hypothetical protein
MNLGAIFSTACLITFSAPPNAQTQDLSPAVGIDQLLRWTMEDIARQRARAREQEAAEEARSKLPDFSQYGIPAESSRRTNLVPFPNELHCTTMNLGGGNSATDCF